MRCYKEPRRLLCAARFTIFAQSTEQKSVFEEHFFVSVIWDFIILMSFTFRSSWVLCGLPPPEREHSRLGMCRFISCSRNGRRKIFAHIRSLMRRRGSEEGSGKSNALEKYHVTVYFRLVSAVFDERALLRWELIYCRRYSGRGKGFRVELKGLDSFITCLRTRTSEFLWKRSNNEK